MNKKLLIFLLMIAAILISRPVLADTENQAGLVIYYEDGTVHTECITFSEQNITGFELLERSSLSIVSAFDPGAGAMVCSVNDQGCPETNCVCEDPWYWSYWHLNGEEWVYSQVGSSIWRVTDGSIDAWKWGTGDQPTSITFDEVCAPAPTATNTPPPTSTFTLEPTATTIPPTATPTIQPSNTAQPTATETTQTSNDNPTSTSAPTNTPLPTATQITQSYPQPAATSTATITAEVQPSPTIEASPTETEPVDDTVSASSAEQPAATEEPEREPEISIATLPPEFIETNVAMLQPTNNPLTPVPQAEELSVSVQEVNSSKGIFQNGLLFFGIFAIILGGVLFFTMTKKKP